MKLQKLQKLYASLTDFRANLSVQGMFQIMEDAITEFMGDLQIDGITTKKRYNAVWVFTKTQVKFLKEIAWNSAYKVTSFISKISHMTIDIDVALENTAGELCAYTRTELCAIDIDNGRLRKVSTVGIDDTFTVETPLIDISFKKIATDKNLTIADIVKVKFTNIDYVMHTNNKEYVRFIMNTYSVSQLKNSPVCELEIAYLNQSYEGDELTICKESIGNEDIFVIQKDDKIITKCVILHT